MKWLSAWAELRATPPREICAALGTELSDPRCPRCSCRLQINDSVEQGVSVRCRSERCRLGRLGWLWPEHFLAEAKNIDIADAVSRIIEAGHQRQQRAQEAERRILEFLGCPR